MVRRAEVVEHAGEDRLGALGVERRGHRLGLGRDRLRRFGRFRCGLRPRGDRLGLRLDGDAARARRRPARARRRPARARAPAPPRPGSTSTTASTLRRRPNSRAKKPTFGASAAAGSAAAGSGSRSDGLGLGSGGLGLGSGGLGLGGGLRAPPPRAPSRPLPAQPRPARAPRRPDQPPARPRRPARPQAPPAPATSSQLRRDRHLRAPSRRLQRHRAACAVALPGDGGLGVQAGDADLSELAQMAGEGVDVRDFRPQLRRALDEGPLRAWILHRVRLSPPARRNPPGPSAVTSPASRRPCRPQGGPIIVHRNY